MEIKEESLIEEEVMLGDQQQAEQLGRVDSCNPIITKEALIQDETIWVKNEYNGHTYEEGA